MGKEGKHPAGRPSKYRDEFCDKLIEHMRQGNSFESFGAVVDCGRASAYNWLAAHPEFLEAKNKGEILSLKFYEDMGKAIATGQLRRVTKEEPVLDARGKPVIDPNTGQVMIRREYAPSVTNAAVWIFTMKNMHGWRDVRNLAVSGDGNGGPVKVRAAELSVEDKTRELLEMHKFLKEVDDGSAVYAEIVQPSED